MTTEYSQARGGTLVYRRKQILEMLGISNATLYSWIADGRFPAPVSLGPNTRAWLASEVEDLLIQRTKERDHQLELALDR
jgi:prophage regulatory protein